MTAEALIAKIKEEIKLWCVAGGKKLSEITLSTKGIALSLFCCCYTSSSPLCSAFTLSYINISSAYLLHRVLKKQRAELTL
jgi:hypothetical protein